MNSPENLQKLLFLVKKIPFIQSKHIYHLTEEILKENENELADFFNKLLALKREIVCCEICFSWKQSNEVCYWCHRERNNQILCIVETWIDAVSLDRAKFFDGLFHVLGGNISPLDGIGPDQLHFEALLERIKNLPLEEILIATNQTPEGEATASYIERIIKASGKKDITVSYLATGIPVGVSLEYVDKLTLQKAIAYRRKSK
jgi:recombination protein RecR